MVIEADITMLAFLCVQVLSLMLAFWVKAISHLVVELTCHDKLNLNIRYFPSSFER